jgi:hypothetical protein
LSGEPKVSNPWTMRDARVDLVKTRNIDLRKVTVMHLILRINTRTNLIY